VADKRVGYMTHSVTKLRQNLVRLQEFLDKDSLVPLPQDEREKLNLETMEILGRIAALDEEFLTVGIIGGTGVGKSTLMNALAEEPISSVSHRRPHTDHVIVYRHEKARQPDIPPKMSLPWREVIHGADSVRQILLCDLPDFDSLVAAHREGVVEFLSQLDLLVWVTSPEKYADNRFYEFLRIAPKAKSNFLFVLNKCDQLFEGDAQESGYRKMDTISRSLMNHLGKEGIESPALFTISSIEAFGRNHASPWNSFPLLKKLIFQQRDMKAVQAIKTENLDVEAEKIFNRIRERAGYLENLLTALDKAIAEWEEDRKVWIRAGRDILSSWLESEGALKLLRLPKQNPPLIGPALWVHSLFASTRYDNLKQDENSHSILKIEPPEYVQKAFKRRLEGIEDRLFQKLLRKDMPPGIRERLLEIISADRRFTQLGEDFFIIISKGIPKEALGRTGIFKLGQRLTYFTLFILLVLALGGSSAWRDILLTPGASSLIDLTTSVVTNLFSEKGLAALGSYTLLNLFFAIRFFFKYRKRLQRSAEKAARAIQSELANAWEGSLHQMLEAIVEIRKEVSFNKNTLEQLGKSQ
jgi:GTPase Era involved in 16S rRNA processing